MDFRQTLATLALAAGLCSAQITVAPPVFYPGSDNGRGVWVRDIDGDQVPDVVVLHPRSLAVYRNLGSGALAPRELWALDLVGDLTALEGSLADFDGDGDLDLAVVAAGQASGMNVLLLSRLVNDGGGNFSFHPAGPLNTTTNYDEIVAGDFNGDGVPDLAAGSIQIQLFFDTPAGFVPGTIIPGSIQDLAAGDMDGDGDIDLVCTRSSPLETQVFLNNGFGGFQALTASPDPEQIRDLVLADIDGDGDLDSVGTTFSSIGTVVFRLNNGTGIFGSAVQVAAYTYADNPTTGDMDGDGLADVVVTDAVRAVFMKNLGGLGFQLSQRAVGNFTNAMGLGDLNGDGRLDVAQSLSGTFDLAILFNTTVGAPPPVPYPGTGEDLHLLTGIAGANPTTGVGEFVKMAPVGSPVGVRIVSPGGAFQSAPFILAVEPFTAGSPPSFPGQPGLHVSPTGLEVLVDTTSGGAFPLVIGSGFAVTGVIPPFLSGQSLMIQAAAVSPTAANGIYGASNGHELIIP